MTITWEPTLTALRAAAAAARDSDNAPALAIAINAADIILSTKAAA